MLACQMLHNTRFNSALVLLRQVAATELPFSLVTAESSEEVKQPAYLDVTNRRGLE